MDYCIKLLSELEKLDLAIFQIDDLKKEFEKRIERQINRQSILLSAILSIIFITWYTSTASGLFTPSVVKITEFESFIQMFALSFLTWGVGLVLTLAFRVLWEKDFLPGGRKTISWALLPKFQKRQQEIAQQTQKVLTKEILLNSWLDKKYLNTKSVSYLSEVLGSRAVNTLDEAVDLLELEVQNQKVRKELIPDENVLTRAQKAIQEDLKDNQVKKSVSKVIFDSFV